MNLNDVPRCDETTCPLDDDSQNCIFCHRGKCYFTAVESEPEYPK